jgi:hypothetical protein
VKDFEETISIRNAGIHSCERNSVRSTDSGRMRLSGNRLHRQLLRGFAVLLLRHWN